MTTVLSVVFYNSSFAWGNLNLSAGLPVVFYIFGLIIKIKYLWMDN
jgi:hypothetical protein